jgi:hypothetical protein
MGNHVRLMFARVAHLPDGIPAGISYTVLFNGHKQKSTAAVLLGGVVSVRPGIRRYLRLVTDPSGTVVSGAAVTATNVGTGAEQNSATNGSGLYQFSALPLGQYEIRAVKTGFGPLARTGVRLSVGENARVDLSLQISGSNQSVTINEDGPGGPYFHREHCGPRRPGTDQRPSA